MSPLDPARWERLRPLLDEALELPPGARAALLDRACGDDAALRAELEALLAADERAERGESADRLRAAADAVARALLETPAVTAATTGSGAAAWIGRSIGPYRVVGLLGEGGMGIVFEAEQAEPRRTVALKVVRGGALVDDARLRLFHREIEALARLHHPAIATIHDAGRTEDGQHFFAMERVVGRPLDAHLRERPAPATSRRERHERLALFLELCDAIAYAHQRGVVHRDLKPSNIVVADAAATPPSGAAPPRLKVLDFGLARITDGDVAFTTLGPGPRAIEGTLPYMSPEQARGAPEAIDTRSDVYALGVILYEMLTGARPYDVHRGALHEGLRVICEVPPARPSARVPALRGDLDTILLKALEKEPSARYATVAALAEDVRRTLADLPIAARPPGALESLRKAARRHRVAAAFGAALAAALVLGAAGTTVGMLRARAAERVAERRAAEAREEARTAESVSRFLVDLFQSSNPDSASTSRLTARELLERGTARIDTALSDQPRVRGRLYHVLGTVNRDLGFHHRARVLLTRAVELRRATLGADHPDVATSEYVLAGLLRRLGEYPEAERHYRDALAIRLRALGPAHRDVAGSYAGLANLMLERGDYAAARPLQERALATIERAVGPDDAAVTLYLFNLALLERAAGDPARARALLERAIRIEERALGPAHPGLAGDLAVLGGVLRDLGDLPAARAHLRRALAICEDALGPEHPRTAEVRADLAVVLDASGDPAGADSLARRAIATFTASLGPGHARTAEAEDVLAMTLARRGRPREAEALSSRAVAALRAALGPRHDVVARALAHRASHRLALGDSAGARADLREALDIQRAVLPARHPDRLATERLLAAAR